MKGLKTHTAEPWFAEGNRTIEIRGNRRALRTIETSDSIAVLQSESPEIAKGDADRIVTCVNGCASLADPETAVPAVIRLLQELENETSCYQKPSHINSLNKKVRRAMKKFGIPQK
jgi:hypothetical protein